MIHQILCALLAVIIISWLLYFYGSEERAKRTDKLLDKNMIVRAINDGMILGMSVVGFMFWVMLLV